MTSNVVTLPQSCFVRMKILVLEDNADRQAAMKRCLEDRFYQFEAGFFDDAREMTEYLDSHLDETILISLDHDLELKSNGAGDTLDPGTGREVADYLARHRPVCPVIIHTTNAPAAAGMEMVLQENKWETRRVAPFGDLEWIPTQWFRNVRQAIVATAS